MKPVALLTLLVVPFNLCLAQTDSLEALAAIDAFQKELNAEYADAKTSPLGPDVLKVFKTHDFFPIDLAYRVRGWLEVTPGTPYFQMKTTTRRYSTERIYGYAHFALAGREFRVPLYQSQELLAMPEYADYLFFPFTDETNGTETYSGGRYIDLRIPKEGDSLIVDFNMAYNPYCAYQSKYSCPIVPAENHLDIPVRAGVKYSSEFKIDTPFPQKIYTEADVPAEYPGGIPALRKFLLSNLTYPKAARKQKVEGTVFVQFIVEADGSVTNIKTIKGLSNECDREAERVIALLPKWKPAQLNGHAIPILMVQPINFHR